MGSKSLTASICFATSKILISPFIVYTHLLRIAIEKRSLLQAGSLNQARSMKSLPDSIQNFARLDTVADGI